MGSSAHPGPAEAVLTSCDADNRTFSDRPAKRARQIAVISARIGPPHDRRSHATASMAATVRSRFSSAASIGPSDAAIADSQPGVSAARRIPSADASRYEADR